MLIFDVLWRIAEPIAQMMRNRSALRFVYRHIYLHTQHWHDTSRLKRESVNYRCERCGRKCDSFGLHTHHPSYAQIGHESLRGLRALCAECHREADAERRQVAGASK
jgi:DNA-directed RNA polymerase subunit RPC12/RpoP